MADVHNYQYRYHKDPVGFKRILWPKVQFYDKQWEVIFSVRDNRKTFVPAGNRLGKDFVAGFICLWYFLTRNPCRVVTTSATGAHLDVLWGEIDWYIQNARFPLYHTQGGPLLVNHQHIRKVQTNGPKKGQTRPISYITSMVAKAETIAAMGGHHVKDEESDGIPRTLFLSDESSSVMDEYEKTADPWADRMYIFGNTWECRNFFRRGVDGGDILIDKDRPELGYYHKVIRITADDHPNIKLAKAEMAAGRQPSLTQVVPGKSYMQYKIDREHLNEEDQCIKLDAKFYQGAGILLFPEGWLRRAKEIAATRKKVLPEKWMGVDPAEGGDKSAWSVIDRYGVIEIVAKKTPDTNEVVRETLALMLKYGIPATNVYFDRGGGKQHADRLREAGYPVNTVGFGEKVASDPAFSPNGAPPPDEKFDDFETKYEYCDRRSQMYGEFSKLLDPSPRLLPDGSIVPSEGFGLPEQFTGLFEELSPIPRKKNEEGRIQLPPKHRRDPNDKRITLTELIGHSPDLADATVLAVHGMLRPVPNPPFIVASIRT